MRVVGSVLGLLGLVVVAGACATGGAGRSRFESTSLSRRSIAEQIATARDSVYAQAIADVEGPGASISASFSNVAGSRRVRATFHLDADAYVIVGHIDASGVMRIVFPVNPDDDGLVKGNKSYQTQEFFAGFADQYRDRMRYSMFRPAMNQIDSYDGGLGYVFMIASWRPMHADRFKTGDNWDSFEIADEEYMKDPRPAIYELGSLLVGENREAYTVKFARYSTTQTLYASGFGGSNSAYGVGMCSSFGFMNYGFASSPFDRVGGIYSMYAAMGMSFYYRGQYYQYNSAFDCYDAGGRSRFGSPTYIAQSGIPVGNPVTGVPGAPKRGFDPENLKRTPLEPRRAPSHMLPGGRVVTGEANRDNPRTSPQYRERGLLTSDDNNDRGPRAFAHREDPRVGPGGGRTRPSIQDMVNRPQPEPVRAAASWRGLDGGNRAGSSAGTRSSFPSPSSYSPSGSRSDGGSSSSVGTSSSTGGSSAAAPPASSGSAAGGRPGTP